MSTHPIQWQAPQPLWGRFGTTPAAAATADDQKRPAILRFASDDFMERVLAILARDPARIDRLVASPESWRSPMAESADLIERTPLPLVAKGAKRGVLARLTKPAVAATVAEADDRSAQGAVRKLPLKLYQPAHQRFYLAVSSLVCAIPGLPERAVATSGGEGVSFVIRRLLPAIPGQATDLREFAYVKDAQGARWQRVTMEGSEARMAFGEELLPVFPLAFQDDAGRARALWGGFVPVGRREEYVSATVDRSAPVPFALAQRQGLEPAEAPAAPSRKLARVAQFQADVAEPWKNLIRASVKLEGSLSQNVNIGGETEPTGSSTKPRRVLDFNLGQQNASWLVLLDFADYLSAYLPDVWNAIDNNGAGYATMSTPRKDLYDKLALPQMSAGLALAMVGTNGKPNRSVQTSLRAALKAIRAAGVREKLEAMPLSYTTAASSVDSGSWPPFHFVLAGVDHAFQAAGPYTALASFGTASSSEFEADAGASPDIAPEANDVDRLTALVGRALEDDAAAEAKAPPLPFALQMKNALTATAGDAGWFVIRFVHQRRDCGPLHPATLSARTQQFQLASFFDPDAPARAIRISLPLDTSPAGLRKHNKNTAFILSDMLCGQVQRAKGLGFIDLVLSVLPWPLHKDLDVGAGGPCGNGLSIGMICSISIPIITICALIILIIMISLLDLIFRWLPFFIMCFPVPGLKGKR